MAEPPHEALTERVKEAIADRPGDELISISPHAPDSVAVVIKEGTERPPVVYLVTFEADIDSGEDVLRWTYLGEYQDQ